MTSDDSAALRIIEYLRWILAQPGPPENAIDVQHEAAEFSVNVQAGREERDAAASETLAMLLHLSGFHREADVLPTPPGVDAEVPPHHPPASDDAIFEHALSACGIVDEALKLRLRADLAANALRAGAVDKAERWIKAARSGPNDAMTTAVDHCLTSFATSVALHRRELTQIHSAVSHLARATARRIADLDPDDPEALVLVGDLALTRLAAIRVDTEHENENIEPILDALEVAELRLAATLGAAHPQTMRIVAEAALIRLAFDPALPVRAADEGDVPAAAPDAMLCTEVLDRLYEYIDSEMPDEDIAAIKRHLDECQQCLEKYGLEMMVKKLVQRCVGVDEPPADLREKVLNRIQQVRGAAPVGIEGSSRVER